MKLFWGKQLFDRGALPHFVISCGENHLIRNCATIGAVQTLFLVGFYGQRKI
jgi:hypothetical protein